MPSRLLNTSNSRDLQADKRLTLEYYPTPLAAELSVNLGAHPQPSSNTWRLYRSKLGREVSTVCGYHHFTALSLGDPSTGLYVVASDNTARGEP